MADKGIIKAIKRLEKQIAKHEGGALTDPAQKLAQQHYEDELKVFKEQLELANKEALKRGLIGLVGVSHKKSYIRC